jgi:hypothetical protein
VNNLGIIVKSSVATLEKLFTSARNRLFTSSEYASGAGESAVGQALAPRAAVFVHVLVLPRFGGCDQQFGGTVMRLLVVIRKNWGGNRTENGARAQAILTSVLRTAQQQDKDAFQLLVDLLRSPQPKLLDIVPLDPLTPAESVPADSAARTLVMTTSQVTDTCADIPLLPDLLSTRGNHIFSSA